MDLGKLIIQLNMFNDFESAVLQCSTNNTADSKSVRSSQDFETIFSTKIYYLETIFFD